ncbi:MAG: STAS/SEC14 domain-containing protein [Okeania sp. SIO3C4]|nr:STAS/SEC14 domain-containing protein [Okeania sp. SIO3C4]
MQRIHPSQNLTSILSLVNQLSAQELEVLLAEIQNQKSKLNPAILSDEEANLLEKINEGLAPELKKRYDILRQKLSDETLSEIEHQELLKITEKIENQNVERLKNLIALAEIRKISLPELAEQLGLKPQVYVA